MNERNRPQRPPGQAQEPRIDDDRDARRPMYADDDRVPRQGDQRHGGRADPRFDEHGRPSWSPGEGASATPPGASRQPPPLKPRVLHPAHGPDHGAGQGAGHAETRGAPHAGRPHWVPGDDAERSPGGAAGASAAGAGVAGARPESASAASRGAADADSDAGAAELQAARDEIAALKAELEASQAQLSQAKDGYVRANAEMENVRRRAQDEVAKAHKYGIEGFAESLVPVMDSLEMALKVETPTVENIRDGVQMTLRQLQQAFEKHHLAIIDPAGEKFDPNLHQAISMAPAAGIKANHVVSVLQKGYRINDRILRPALVTVSQGG